MLHYRCLTSYITNIALEILSDTTELFPVHNKLPSLSPEDAVTSAADDLIEALQNPAPSNPILQLWEKQTASLKQLADISFFLMVNIHFWNYYIPSHSYVREPPFNLLDSTSLESTFLRILAHNFHLSFFADRTISRKAHRAHELAPLPNLPTPETLRPTLSHIYPPPR